MRQLVVKRSGRSIPAQTKQRLKGKQKQVRMVWHRLGFWRLNKPQSCCRDIQTKHMSPSILRGFKRLLHSCLWHLGMTRTPRLCLHAAGDERGLGMSSAGSPHCLMYKHSMIATGWMEDECIAFCEQVKRSQICWLCLLHKKIIYNYLHSLMWELDYIFIKLQE